MFIISDDVFDLNYIRLLHKRISAEFVGQLQGGSDLRSVSLCLWTPAMPLSKMLWHFCY